MEGNAVKFERILLAAGIHAITDTVPLKLETVLDNFVVSEGREELLSLAVEEKMVPMLDAMARARRWDLLSISKLNKIFQHTTDTLFASLAPVASHLRNDNISVVYLKGADFMLSTYPKQLNRMMHDIDLLVRPPDIPTVVDAFRAEGYIQSCIADLGQLLLKPLTAEDENRWFSGPHYEVPRLSKFIRLPSADEYAEEIREHLGKRWSLSVIGDDVYYLLGYEVHLNVASDVELTDVWENTRTLQHPNGPEMLALSPTVSLWYLASKFYHETMMRGAPRRIRQFIDLMAFAYKFCKSIDWDRLLEVANKYKLHPSLYYVFWHVNELLGPTIPDHVIDYCNPSNSHVERLHDWGDFMPKLLNMSVVAPV